MPRVKPAATQAQQGVGRLIAVLDRSLRAVRTVKASRAEDREAAEIRFHGVGFGYTTDRMILDDVGFTVPAGSRTAIVGPSGAGKSTVLALIERFYEADRGSVTVDGVDVRDIPLNTLRRLIAYVEQETPVLAGTVGENISYAHPEATDAELHEVIGRVGLDGLVARLPAGLATDVGDAGVLMSGGERQRVSIARALVGTPRVLLLDEATSQLDALNELAMRETVRRVAGPMCTVVTVAHRLSTVVDADQIIVLEQGRIAAVGTHQELLSTSQVYLELVQGQLLSATETVPEVEDFMLGGEPEVLAAGEEALEAWRRAQNPPPGLGWLGGSDA